MCMFLRRVADDIFWVFNAPTMRRQGSPGDLGASLVEDLRNQDERACDRVVKDLLVIEVPVLSKTSVIKMSVPTIASSRTSR